MIKSISKNPTVYLILCDKRPNAFSLRSGTRQRCPPSPLPFNTELEVPAPVTWQEKGMEGIQIGREEMRLPLFKDGITYIENPRNLQTTPTVNK